MRAQLAYENKTVKITGPFSDAREAGGGLIEVTIAGRYSLSVVCELTATGDNKAKAAAINEGDMVTVQGKCCTGSESHRYSRSLSLTSCSIGK